MEGRAVEPRKQGMTSPDDTEGQGGFRHEELTYSALFKRFLPYTRRLLLLRGVPERDRSDVAQDAWVRVYANLDSYDPERPFEAWLRAIVFRTACDYFKKAAIRRERLSEAGQVETQAPARMEERVIDASRTLEAALSQLSDEHREVFVLAEIEEVEPKEIAALLAIPANTVHSRLSRAREQFSRAVDRLRAAEKRRLGAAFVLPVFLLDWRALAEHGREIPPVSAPVESDIWQGVCEGIARLATDSGGLDGAEDAASAAGAPRASLPPVQAPSSSLPLALARLPWFAPVGVAAVGMLVGGLSAGGLVSWLSREPAPTPSAVLAEPAPAATASTSDAPASTTGAPPATTLPPPADASAPVVDPRAELATLEAAWTLYLQGKCSAARTKLGSRKARVHAKDYEELRQKIEACLSAGAGTP